MRRLGLLGGMSWESTAIYYRLINEGVNARLSGLHSCDMLIHSVDFAQIAAMQANGEWEKAGELLGNAARGLENAGAQAIVLCTNTMHKIADNISAHITIPLIHIADATAQAIKAEKLTKVGLLATKFTMEHEFYRGRLEKQHGIQIITPLENERNRVHEIIYDELCKGHISASSRQEYLAIIEKLITKGAQGIILGCTEIGMLIGQNDVRFPVFDSTMLHVKAAVDFALSFNE
jgi:aspartate racemase